MLPKSDTTVSANTPQAEATSKTTDGTAPSYEKASSNVDSTKEIKSAPSEPKSLRYFAGIEGGATATTMIILDSDRNIVAEGETGPSNPWLLGFEETAKLLMELIEQTIQRADKPIELYSIGMSLSGAGQSESRRQLKAALKDCGAQIDNIFIEEDILAPVFALSSQGGVNMICGTGSNCVVYNGDGVPTTCGGWGHLLGDEAGGYWIAQRAVKTILDHLDNYHKTKDDIRKVQQSLLKYMEVKSMEDLLGNFYKTFSKDFIAGFTKELGKLANNGDHLAKNIFKQAGFEIGRHLLAIQPAIKSEMLTNSVNLRVLCTGGVFKMWSHIKPGIIDILERSKANKNPVQKIAKYIAKGNYIKMSTPKLHPEIKEISFVKLLIPASIGAAIWAAKQSKSDIKEAKSTERISELIDTIYIL